MADSKYSKYFVFQDKPNLKLPDFRHEIPREFAHRLVYLDKDIVSDANFYVEALWFWPGERPKPGETGGGGPEPHTHPFDEMIAFDKFQVVHHTKGAVIFKIL